MVLTDALTVRHRKPSSENRLLGKENHLPCKGIHEERCGTGGRRRESTGSAKETGGRWLVLRSSKRDTEPYPRASPERSDGLRSGKIKICGKKLKPWLGSDGGAVIGTGEGFSGFRAFVFTKLPFAGRDETCPVILTEKEGYFGIVNACPPVRSHPAEKGIIEFWTWNSTFFPFTPYTFTLFYVRPGLS